VTGVASATTKFADVAAGEMLRRGGSAVDAVLAGFFAEAGGNEDVLLAPFCALVAGTGAGERAFDGRACQAGAGAERPRRFTIGDEPPLVARVAASRTVATTALMHAARGRVEMPAVVAFGVKLARDLGAGRRAALLEDIGESRSLALAREPIVEAFLASGGRPAGGSLSRSDLVLAPREDAALAGALGDNARVLRVPWAFEPGPEGVASGAEIIVAIDARGLVAVVAYERVPSIEVPGLQIALPCVGIPVLRGVPRIAPGTPLFSAAPIAILEERPNLKLALGVASGRDERPAGLVSSRASGPMSISDDALAALVGAIPLDAAARRLAGDLEGRFVCVALEREKPRVVAAHAAA